MKKMITGIIMAALFAVSASAANWTYTSTYPQTINDGDWWLNVGQTVVSGVTNLTVSGVRTNGTNPHVDLSKGFTSGTYKITSVAGFQNNQTLTAITLPSTLTNITSRAFRYCSNLVSSVVIPSGVTTIGSDAFENCVNLTDVTFAQPSALKTFERIFNGCSNLTSIVIPEGVTSLANAAFSGNVNLLNITLPSTLTNIGNSAFQNCGLTSIAIPEGITAIRSYTFSACFNLQSVTLPSTITYMDPYTFRYCSNLTSVVLSEGITSLGSYAFENCVSLPSVTLPSTLTNMGTGAFINNSNLTSVVIPEGSTVIGQDAFQNCGLTSVTLPSTITNMGIRAFRYCSNLTSVVMAEGFTSLGQTAFANCVSLTSVTLPSTLTNIESAAFSGCSSLTSIVIPESVTRINDFIFEYCFALTNVFFPGPYPVDMPFNRDIYGSSSSRMATNAVTYITLEHAESWVAATNNYVTGGMAALMNGSALWQSRPIRLLEVTYVTVNFVTGSTNVPRADITVGVGGTYHSIPATLSRAGYTFNGWFDEPVGGNRITNGVSVVKTTDHTLYAQWTGNNYTVYFNGNGGGTPSPSSKQVAYGGAYGDLATCVRAGYVLTGWFTATSGGEERTASSIVTNTANHTLYAQWEIPPVTVTVVPGKDGTTNTVDDIRITSGSIVRSNGYIVVSSGDSVCNSTDGVIYRKNGTTPVPAGSLIASNGTIFVAGLTLHPDGSVTIPSNGAIIIYISPVWTELTFPDGGIYNPVTQVVTLPDDKGEVDTNGQHTRTVPQALDIEYAAAPEIDWDNTVFTTNGCTVLGHTIFAKVSLTDTNDWIDITSQIPSLYTSTESAIVALIDPTQNEEYRFFRKRIRIKSLYQP